MMDNKPEGDLPIFLVADDERQIGMMHREYCRMYFPGSEFVFVQDGLEAFEMLQTRRFDVLITDHQMPGITGIDLLKRLKEIDLKIFKAVFSGSGAVERVYEAYQILGADIVLPKPDVRNFWISLKEKLQ